MQYPDPDALYDFLANYLTESRKALFEKVLDFRTDHLTIAVEDLHKEQNASAVVRSCDCFGIQSLHIIQEHNPYKVSTDIAMGAERWVDVHLYSESVDNGQECLDKLRANGYKIVATTPDRSASTLQHFDLNQRAAFIFGGEKMGLSEKIFNQADELLTIPNVGFTESFNVSVSAAIILHQLTQRLHQSKDIAWQLSPERRIQQKIKWAIKTIPKGERMVNHFYNHHRYKT